MKVCFFESGALAKLFVMGEGSQPMVDLVEPLAQAQKLLASLGFIELHSATGRRERAGDLAPAHAGQAIAILSAD